MGYDQATPNVKEIEVASEATYDPGGASFLAWSTILTSACFSRGRISPPLTCEAVSNVSSTMLLLGCSLL